MEGGKERGVERNGELEGGRKSERQRKRSQEVEGQTERNRERDGERERYGERERWRDMMTKVTELDLSATKPLRWNVQLLGEYLPLGTHST